MINQEVIPKLLEETKGLTIVAATKYGDELDDLLHDLDITWHFIGHLQSKKVKSVINKVDYLHSLDRMSLVTEIQKHRLLPLNCFLEVNISEEENKEGLDYKEVVTFYQNLVNYDKIRIVGLMGMATLTDDEDLIRKQFQKLVDLRRQINEIAEEKISYLSMGMSNDYLLAMELGATHLRLGSILFRKEE